MIVETQQHILCEDILERCYARAPRYDAENRFFEEDFQELRDAGYLLMAIPEEFGGLGMSLADVCREPRRLAYYAHATVLAVNMHLYWTGVAADLWRAGDTSCTWLLGEAAAGEVLAAGHAEHGNDLPLFFSTTRAERVAGGYCFTGRKSFDSLSPVIVSAKYRAVEGAWRAVDRALEAGGGFGVFKASGVERLVRDARLGRIHPANAFVTHKWVAKTAFGIDMDEPPRWG